MSGTGAQKEERYAFGPFVLVPERRMLLREGKPVDIGSRALAILTVLASRSPSPVSQAELFAAGWPGTHVSENNLRMTVAQIRKIFRASSVEDMLVTLPNQGYLLASPPRVDDEKPPAPHGLGKDLPPPSPNRLIGREAVVREVVDRLEHGRLVTLVGPGGMGKTRLACEVFESLRMAARESVYVDLAPVSDSRFVNEALASAVGVGVGSGRPLQPMADLLRGQNVLLIIDNCEHLLDALALAAMFLLTDVQDLTVLATSREPLRLGEEHVVRLPALVYPMEAASVDEGCISDYPALTLLVERIASSGFRAEPEWADIQILVDISKRLEGVPLAIEIAAAHVAHFGLRGVLDRLDSRFQLASAPRRRGDLRNQTIRGMLDWSYGLLEEKERITLRRLALLRSPFTAECAVSVVSSHDIDPDEVQSAILELASKSLLNVEAGSSPLRFRLLEMTRTHAMERLQEAGELDKFASRHSEHCLAVLKKFEIDRQTTPIVELLPIYRNSVPDVRAALQWALSERRNIMQGVQLAIACDLLWSQLSMMEEYSEIAREALATWRSEGHVDTVEELKLLISFGAVLWNTKGPILEVEAIYRKALDIAEKLQDLSGRLWALWGLWLFKLGRGAYEESLSYAARYIELAPHTTNPEVELVGYRARTLALMYAGEFEEASHNAKQILAGSAPVLGDKHTGGYLFQQRVTARSNYARMLWIQGLPDQARQHAAQAVKDAISFEHYPSICFALAIAACPVAQWSGQWEEAIEYTDMLIDVAGKHGLLQWLGFGECHRFTLSADPARAELKWDDLTLPQIETLVTLDEGVNSLSLLPRMDPTRKTWAAAEIARTRAREMMSNGAPGQHSEEVVSLYSQAIHVAQNQRALSWELRAAVDLAEYLGELAPCSAIEILAPVIARFEEGQGTRDLQRARKTLDRLSSVGLPS